MFKLIKLLFPFILLTLSSCSFSNEPSNSNLTPGNPKEGVDLIEVDESASYYISKDISMTCEVNGYYTVIKYFTLDESNSDLRVYDNMYFYKDDYFFFLSNDMRDWYADIDENQYVEKELAEGEDYHINFLSDGVYRITFDIKTKKCDVIFLKEIETPKYFTIQNCEIRRFINSREMVHVRMDVNPDNEKELMYKNYPSEIGYFLYFVSVSHVSTYKITIDESSYNVTVKYGNSKRTNVKTLVSVSLNIFLNTETYVVRVEQS